MTVNLSDQINEFLSFKVGMENASNRTKLAYSHDLISKFLPFVQKRNKTSASTITQNNIEDFLLEIKSGSLNGSVANMNRKLAAIKSLFAFLEKKGFIQDNPAKDIQTPKAHKTTITYLSEEEKNHLLETVQQSSTPFYKNRDLAIFKLFLGTGIRVSELIYLKVKDLDLRSQGISYIRIKRKGGNEASLPINNKVVFTIKTYLKNRENQDPEQAVFLSKTGHSMRANTVYYLVKHYLVRAGIEKRKWGPHLLRHTVGVTLRRQGVDIATIQHLLGHRKLETTAIYLNVESQDLEKAVQLL